MLRGVSECLISGNSLALVNRTREGHTGVLISAYKAGGVHYVPRNNAIVSNLMLRLDAGVVETRGAGPTHVTANTFIDVAVPKVLSHPDSKSR